MTLEEVKRFQKGGLDSLPRDWVPITLDDDNDLTFVARALMNLSLTNDYTVAVYTVESPSVARTITIPNGEFRTGLFTRVLVSGTTGSATLAGAV